MFTGLASFLEIDSVTPERYWQIKAIFQHALGWPASERASLLETACHGDSQLLEEVRALLESSDSPSTAIDRPAVGEQFRLRLIHEAESQARPRQ